MGKALSDRQKKIFVKSLKNEMYRLSHAPTEFSYLSSADT